MEQKDTEHSVTLAALSLKLASTAIVFSILYFKRKASKEQDQRKKEDYNKNIEFLKSMKSKKELDNKDLSTIRTIINRHPELSKLIKDKLPENKNYSNMEQNETNYSATKAVKVKMPSKSASPTLTKVKKWKRVLVYLQAKKDVASGKSGLAQWSSGDEAKLKKVKGKYDKARKQAAPELIKLNRAKRAARGRGKKRGSTLAKLGNKK